jgi:flagellar hook assembly protein FlgD
MLGETSFRPLAALAAWPLPYRGGNLTVSFATANGVGGASARAEVGLYDVSGRLVRRITQGSYGAGYQSAVWDGRDSSGRKVATGIYFIRSQSGDHVERMKLAVLR